MCSCGCETGDQCPTINPPYRCVLTAGHSGECESCDANDRRVMLGAVAARLTTRMTGARVPLMKDLTPAQRTVILRAQATMRGRRATAVPYRTASVLVRKGYATASYRHTSNGYIIDLTLTEQGRQAQKMLVDNQDDND